MNNYGWIDFDDVKVSRVEVGLVELLDLYVFPGFSDLMHSCSSRMSVEELAFTPDNKRI